jgi:hypothetical protein
MPHSDEYNISSDQFLEKLWRGIHRWISSIPFLVFWKNDVGVNEGKWCIRINALTFRLRTLNAPAAGNPTKWIPIDDNGTTRYIPAW